MRCRPQLNHRSNNSATSAKTGGVTLSLLSYLCRRLFCAAGIIIPQDIPILNSFPSSPRTCWTPSMIVGGRVSLPPNISDEIIAGHGRRRQRTHRFPQWGIRKQQTRYLPMKGPVAFPPSKGQGLPCPWGFTLSRNWQSVLGGVGTGGKSARISD